MPTGRKPTPLKLVDNAKARHTKETLDGRQISNEADTVKNAV